MEDGGGFCGHRRRSHVGSAEVIMLRFQDIVFGMGMLILTYLILVHWEGANNLLVSGGRTVISLTRTLQGR